MDNVRHKPQVKNYLKKKKIFVVEGMVVNSLSSVTGESLDVHMKFYDVMS